MEEGDKVREGGRQALQEGDKYGVKLRCWRCFGAFGTFSLRSFGYFDEKKHVKMASIRNFCDRFPCEIAESLKPFGSCHKRCIHSLGLAII